MIKSHTYVHFICLFALFICCRTFTILFEIISTVVVCNSMRFVCFLYIHIHCTFLYICLNKAINKTLSQHFDVFKSKSWHCYSKIKWLDIYIYRRIFRIRMNSLTHLTHSKLICFHSAWKFSFMLEWSQYLPLFRFISFLHSPILLLFFFEHTWLWTQLNWTEQKNC